MTKTSPDLPPTSLPGQVRRVFVALNVSETIVVVAATALVLRAMGRVGWCKCGSWIPWSWDIWSMHNSQHMIDPYFFTHILHGILFFGALYLLSPPIAERFKFMIAMGVEGCWEIAENTPLIIQRYREATISLDYYGDSIINSIFDILACAIGYGIAARVGLKGSLIYIAATELLLLMTIGDCLLLNIIMLVCPIEAIKQWQTPLPT
jgi:hypothetical protein